MKLSEFLSAFFPDQNERINFRAFKPKDAPDSTHNPAAKISFSRRELTSAENQIELRKLNHHRGVYFVVNFGGDSDKQIIRFNAVFVENDVKTVEEQHTALDKCPVPTSIRIETKKSVHAYWLLGENCSAEKWGDTQRRVIDFFDGDTAIKNPSRVMRLPFFQHLTYNPKATGNYDHKLVELKQFNPERRYTIEQLKEGFPLVDGKKSNKQFNGTNTINKGSRNKELFSLACGLCRKGLGETEILAELTEVNQIRVNPPLPDSELRGIAKSSVRYKPEPNEVNESEAPDGDTDCKTQTHTLTKLVESEEVTLFHNSEKEAFAAINIDGITQTFKIESRHFKSWLSFQYYKSERKATSGQSLNDAIRTIQGKAVWEAEAHEVYVRFASLDGKIYVDLCNDQWEIVEISKEGWRIIDAENSPVRFRRTPAMRSLVTPEKGKGDLSKIDELLNASDDELVLIKMWLIAAFRPDYPFPVLILKGEQGTAKSTATKVLRYFVDPNKAPIKAPPKNIRDLILLASNAWVVAYDNIAQLKPWLSNGLCSLSTGGGISTRLLYSNDEEAIFEAKRPIILNGIGEIANAGDLLDRALVNSLKAIPKENRMTEEAFWEKLEHNSVAIFTGLLDTVSGALANLEKVTQTESPRMADFAKWAAAAEEKIGLEKGEFMKIYMANRENINSLILEDSLLADAIHKLYIDQKSQQLGLGFLGTAKDLLTKLKHIAPKNADEKSFPKSPRGLRSQIDRIAPNLRQVGINVIHHKRTAKGAKIEIKFDKNALDPSASGTDSEKKARDIKERSEQHTQRTQHTQRLPNQAQMNAGSNPQSTFNVHQPKSDASTYTDTNSNNNNGLECANVGCEGCVHCGPLLKGGTGAGGLESRKR